MKKLGVFIPLFLTIVLAFSIINNVNATSIMIYGDTSDGWVSDTGGINSGFVGLRVGDNYDPPTGYNLIYHNFVKFDLSGVPKSIVSARLYLYLFGSTNDGASDNTDPLTNPGLGACLVRHVDDYGTIDGTDYNSPSIGNDPGVLIGSTATPNKGYISIDITAAMQDDIDNGRSFSTFLIRLSTDTDNDDAVDEWMFYSADQSGTDRDPYIEYTVLEPVGGIYAPMNKLNIVVPYAALVGLIGAVSTIFAIRRWHKN